MSEHTSHEPAAPANTTAAQDPARPPSGRRRFWRLAAAVTAVAALAACAQPGPGGEGRGPGWGHHHRHGGFASMDPEAIGKRIDRAVEWVLSDVGATADQKTRVAAIARQAAAEVAPLREQHRAARRQGIELLAAAQIDRGALERLRAEQLRQADQASQRLVRALADIAEVLTPEQRVRLKERLDRRMNRMGR